MAGISIKIPPFGPASNTRTVVLRLADKRRATVLPADPEPTKKII